MVEKAYTSGSVAGNIMADIITTHMGRNRAASSQKERWSIGMDMDPMLRDWE
jgi:hypothetical protein